MVTLSYLSKACAGDTIVGEMGRVWKTIPSGIVLQHLLLCFYVSEGLMGELELFSGAERGCSSVTSVSDLCCIAIPIDSNRSYLEGNLQFTRIAASELAKKLVRSSQSVVDNTLYTAEIRLCRYILAAAENNYFRDVMTDVACSIGVSYRHLYRMLGKLCKEEVLTKTESGYWIKRYDWLEELCQQR